MTDQTLRVVVVGAGGMGALFGAILSNGGLSVTLVDTDSAHVDAVRRNGLHISGLGGDRYQQIAVENDVSKIDQADVVLVQCKGTSTEAAAQSMQHLANGKTVFVSFQNGLGNEDILARHLGVENVFGGLTSMAGARQGPGFIHDFDRVPSCIGEWRGGMSQRASDIAARFSAAGLETRASADIRTDIWKKLLGNMTMSAVSGLTNLTSTEALNIGAIKQVCLTALDEAISIAHSQGVMLDKQTVIDGLALMTAPGGTGDNKSSLCLDLLAKRPSEVEFIYGRPLELADEAGLNVPTLRALHALVTGVESHYVDKQPDTETG